ncbi:unnamed protein product [Paramecium sonneborni]|uniref:WD40-repeat-containing domain n=1 Tax=Paramecium sonneborni TaxID=65129 RepID=A0A8S1RNE6_9CILI|nr:unnamed protein product [Paramecium sonneborni]
MNEVVQQLKKKINESYLSPFRFDLVEQPSQVSQKESCYAIAINKGFSTLVTGCDSKIKVFEFKQGMLKQIQILDEHQDYVTTLNFMKNQNQFLSGSYDSSVIIWSNEQHNQWISQQKLNGKTICINCLIVNNNEDLIVLGCYDRTIQFWIKENEWLCLQAITDHSSSVYGLSLNQQQNRIISCGYDNQILIIEQSQQNKEWIVIQKIKVEQYGYRICFIDNNMFTFQSFDKEQMSIFKMSSINKQYTQIQHISVKGGSDFNCFFPQQYIKAKSILVNKNGEYTNLIRKKQNGEFLTQQSIHLGTSNLTGVMSEDGQYLITWDDKSKQIQIRKYNEEE